MYVTVYLKPIKYCVSTTILKKRMTIVLNTMANSQVHDDTKEKILQHTPKTPHTHKYNLLPLEKTDIPTVYFEMGN